MSKITNISTKLFHLMTSFTFLFFAIAFVVMSFTINFGTGFMLAIVLGLFIGGFACLAKGKTKRIRIAGYVLILAGIALLPSLYANVARSAASLGYGFTHGSATVPGGDAPQSNQPIIFIFFPF